MNKNESIFIHSLLQKLNTSLIIVMMFTSIYFLISCQPEESDTIVNPEIGSLMKVFDENKNDYAFTGELLAKFNRFKSKGEIKRWEVGKLNSKITFTLEMKYILNIFENEFEFEITEVSNQNFLKMPSYWAKIRNGGSILFIGDGVEYAFYIGMVKIFIVLNG